MNTNQQRGTTLIELLITLIIVGIFIAIIGSRFWNPPGKTEASAYEAAAKFIATNNLIVKRKTCAHDSDNDGQASCTIVTEDGEKIFLSCPVGILNTAMGAESCKEVGDMLTIQGTSRRR